MRSLVFLYIFVLIPLIKTIPAHSLSHPHHDHHKKAGKALASHTRRKRGSDNKPVNYLDYFTVLEEDDDERHKGKHPNTNKNSDGMSRSLSRSFSRSRSLSLYDNENNPHNNTNTSGSERQGLHTKLTKAERAQTKEALHLFRQTRKNDAPHYYRKPGETCFTHERIDEELQTLNESGTITLLERHKLERKKCFFYTNTFCAPVKRQNNNNNNGGDGAEEVEETRCICTKGRTWDDGVCLAYQGQSCWWDNDCVKNAKCLFEKDLQRIREEKARKRKERERRKLNLEIKKKNAEVRWVTN